MTDEEKDEQFYRDTESIAFRNSTIGNSRCSSHSANDARCGTASSSSKQGNAISG
jgi:hypothetical protein